MTFEELQKANAEIKTLPLKGKEYAEVNQRIKVFRMLFPDGCIHTDIVSIDGGVCVIRATVLDENGRELATGTAYEKEGSSNVNRTSYIENCETSAVGRALGMLGIGIDVSVASYEEVSNAIEAQDKPQAKTQAKTQGKPKKPQDGPTAEELKAQKQIENSKISDIKVKSLLNKCQADGVAVEKILKLYKVEKLGDLTELKFRNILDFWEDIKKVQ